VLASLLAACSSSSADPAAETSLAPEPTPDSVEEPETTTTSTTTTSTTIAPTTTTTDPPPVVDTVATEASESAPETTVGEPVPEPTNTTFDPATLEGEVEQAVLADQAAFVVCLEELPSCDVDKATANAFLDYGDGNKRLINEWNDAGYVARDTETYLYRVDEIELFVEDTEALVMLCVSNGVQQVLPGVDSSPETIVSDEFTSTINRFLVRRIGDQWLVTANDPLESATGEAANLCA